MSDEALWSWDDVLPQGSAEGTEWELRVYTREIRRSCPKCGGTGDKNWTIRWTRALKFKEPALPPPVQGECLRVQCVRCGWQFFMETQEAAERRSGGGPAPVTQSLSPPHGTGGGRTGPPTEDRIRGRIRLMGDAEGQRLIDRVLELADEDGRLCGTWQADLRRILREALSCSHAGDEQSVLRRARVRVEDCLALRPATDAEGSKP